MARMTSGLVERLTSGARRQLTIVNPDYPDGETFDVSMIYWNILMWRRGMRRAQLRRRAVRQRCGRRRR
jgi:hypothetical protein